MGNIKLISVFMFFAVLLMVPSISSAQMVIYSEDFSGTPDWTGTGSATIISDAVQIGNGGDGSARVPSGTVDISNYDNVSVQFDLSNLLVAGNAWEDNDFIDLVCTWAGGTSPGSYTVQYGRIDSTPLTPPEGDDAGSDLQLISGGLGNPATIAIGATSTITVCDQTIVPDDATSIYLTVSLDNSTNNEIIGADNVEFLGDPVSDISLTKTSNATNGVVPGSSLTYTVTFVNEGPVPVPAAADISFTDNLPSGVSFVSIAPSTGCTHDGSPTGGVITCTNVTLGPLTVDPAAGSSRSWDIVVQVQGSSSNGMITNSATITGYTQYVDPNSSNNTGEITDAVVPTLTEWGMIIFMVLAGLGAMYYMRRQRITTS